MIPKSSRTNLGKRSRMLRPPEKPGGNDDRWRFLLCRALSMPHDARRRQRDDIARPDRRVRITPNSVHEGRICRGLRRATSRHSRWTDETKAPHHRARCINGPDEYPAGGPCRPQVYPIRSPAATSRDQRGDFDRDRSSGCRTGSVRTAVALTGEDPSPVSRLQTRPLLPDASALLNIWPRVPRCGHCGCRIDVSVRLRCFSTD
jgi:hypothetical protein